MMHVFVEFKIHLFSKKVERNLKMATLSARENSMQSFARIATSLNEDCLTPSNLDWIGGANLLDN